MEVGVSVGARLGVSLGAMVAVGAGALPVGDRQDVRTRMGKIMEEIKSLFI